ncbi:hypothetical protein HK105_208038 [Polyrhizophydium stewartii]|uniref:Uncharacterized protein n=1 Tax=Polyrhizophydium stewartii TaxID=2732419 RepID=A0ABR4MZ53_9FUNG|nr:hypothetical protein HK105_006024 [Polyrhizophydium stewartii]
MTAPPDEVPCFRKPRLYPETNIMIYTPALPEIEIPVVDIPTLIFNSEHYQKVLSQPLMTDTLGEYLTFEDLIQDSGSLAGGVRKTLGLKKWDVVGVYALNNIDFPYVVYGLLRAGCTISPINAAYTHEEVAFQLKDSGAIALIVDPLLVPRAKVAAQLAGIPASHVFVMGDAEVDGVQPLSGLMDEPMDPVEFTQEELKTKPAYLTYSSGTTGRSKGVVTSHYNVVSNVLQMYQTMKLATGPGESCTGALPFTHMYGLVAMLHTAPYMGVHVITIPKFDFATMLKVISKVKPTTLYLVPPIMIGLAKHPAVAMADLSSVKYIISGAAPLSAELSQALTQRLPHIKVMQGYGLTETSPVAALSMPETAVHGSAGMLVPNSEARLVDPETGLDVPKGERGELWLRGPHIMLRYLNLPETTAEALTADGYFRTGDIATIDEHGNIFIVDRLKELVKYAGLQVPPAELEAKLLTHSKIADAAVIGIPDDISGELPLAYVVLQPGAEITEKEIQDYIAERVADHKQLRGGVIFTDAVPKAPSGKILRRVLREKDAARRAALAAGNAA